MLRLDRSRTAGRYLEWKVRIFTVGAVLAVVGMYLEEEWMTGAAILVLLGGFVLRFVPGVDDDAREDEAQVGRHGGVDEGPSGP